MKKKERFKSFYALLVLLVFGVVIYLLVNYSITADKGESFYNATPLKVGDNYFTSTKPVDLASRIIGINGSLLTIDEAKRRGVISGIFDTEGSELDKMDLLVRNASFIIKVEDINASPALFLEGIK